MVQETVRQAIKPGRLHPTAFHIQLDERDALNEFPRDDIRRHITRLRRILTHDEPHFLRLVASAGASHALEERGDGEWRVDLERAFEPADVDAQFEGRRRDGGHAAVLVLHLLFGTLPDGRRKVAVVDEEAVRLMPYLAVLAQGGGHGFGFLAGIAEYEAFAATRVFEDVADARVSGLWGGVRGGFGLGERAGKWLVLPFKRGFKRGFHRGFGLGFTGKRCFRLFQQWSGCAVNRVRVACKCRHA